MVWEKFEIVWSTDFEADPVKMFAGTLQRFVSIFSAIRNLFVPPSAKRSSLEIHIHRFQAMEQW